MKSIPYWGHPLVIGGLLLVSCAGFGRAGVTLSSSRTPTASLPSPIESVTAPPSAMPTKETTEAVSVTATRVPTLAPEQAQVVVLELLETNGNCELPCWWGLVPGQTTWYEALALLEPIASRIAQYGPADATPNRAEVFFLTLPKDIASPYIELDFAIHGGVVERIVVSGIEWPNYQIPQFLSTYGQPREVWVHTEGFTSEPHRSLGLVLFYPEHGVLASYSTEGDLVSGHIHGCFERNPSLRLWPSEQARSFTEAAQLFSWDVQSVLYLPLSDATGMSVETFFQTSEEAVCLQTPQNLWP